MTVIDQTENIPVSRVKNMALVNEAMVRSPVLSREGISERLFALAFSVWSIRRSGKTPPSTSKRWN